MILWRKQRGLFVPSYAEDWAEQDHDCRKPWDRAPRLGSGAGVYYHCAPRSVGFVPPASVAFWGNPVAADITLNGADVSGWVDHNGSARTMDQPTAADQPLWEATGIGGAHPSIYHNIANTEYLFSDDAGLGDIPNGSDVPCAVVVYMQFPSLSAAATKIAFGWGFSGGNNPQLFVAQTITPLWTVNKRDDSGAQASSTSTEAPDTGFHTVALKHAGTTVSLYVDNVALTNIDAAASNVGTVSFDRFAIGAIRKAAAASHADVRHGQMFVLNSASDADIQACEDYLADFYA